MRVISVLLAGAVALSVAGCSSSTKSSPPITQTGITASTTTPTTRPKPTDPASKAVDTYLAYVDSEAAKLVSGTHDFTQAVIQGDLQTAKRLYAATRTHYESIKPVAEKLGPLDAQIDARAKDVDAFYFEGFHRIERQLWVKHNTEGMTPVARSLAFHVGMVQTRLPEIRLSPAVVAAGALDLLNEIATTKFNGEEERYSHTDLWDFAAKLAGARQAIAALRPIVFAKNPALAKSLDSRFESTTDALHRYRKGDGYVLYTALSASATRALAARVDTLAVDVAKVRQLVKGS